jgi:hypothetical protein
VLADLGLDDDAATLHGATRRPRTGPAPYGADSDMLQHTANALLLRLGQHDFDTHASRGAGLPDDEVVEFALEAVRRARDAEHHQVSSDDSLNAS